MRLCATHVDIARSAMIGFCSNHAKCFAELPLLIGEVACSIITTDR